MNSNTIQVFEHELLQIGEEREGAPFTEAHYQALAQFYPQHNGKYYALQPAGVRFNSYVGVLQVGPLSIEILPKASRDSGAPPQLWQRLLLDMLRACRFLKVEQLSGPGLQLRPNTLLDFYLSVFFEETERLLRQGLVKDYRREDGNLRALKGRLLFHRQVRENHIHQERFSADFERYTYGHLFNRILGAALQALRHFPLGPALEVRLQRLLRQFPEVEPPADDDLNWERLAFGRKTHRYQVAVEIALLLLRQYQPQLRAGQYPLIALLFDMNTLFEEYVYRQLSNLRLPGLQVYRQASRPFWDRHYLQPDIVLEYEGNRYVLDTKWKLLQRASPSMADLRQMYVYARYFDAPRGVLLYPRAYELADTIPTPFAADRVEEPQLSCQVVFVDIIKDGRLNKEMGKAILDKLVAPISRSEF
ncbi:MAG: restriction endonuclease [Phaeodactylibacter sp.]|nr:restriction endonuclease [Phaeodactylibacter sp.]